LLYFVVAWRVIDPPDCLTRVLFMLERLMCFEFDGIASAAYYAWFFGKNVGERFNSIILDG